ncbi:MAG: AmmeMemoRadiSam system radical SAM enzyme [Candidatus Omnitrophica bacterium]|nr:AmmeMemoRadiSam system radical SAM enzyme [Candidatus Omnitrophota bacterium]
MKEALFYKKLEQKQVKCFLCNHNCLIALDNFGRCRVRQNKNGSLYSLNYGEVVAANIDPIEKKPFFHFLVGSVSFSIACVGCNFSCDFCQNWEISQEKEAKKLNIKTNLVTPDEIINLALKANCPSISYTYTEPTIYFEFAFDCCKLAKQKGLKNAFVTNGYISKDSLEYISAYLDAANVDLKSFNEDFYKKICKATLKPVLENIILMKRLNIWVEVTTLLIPGLNDSKQELKKIAEFLVSVDKNLPWHISAFHPDYKLTNIQATEFTSLKIAYQIGKEAGLNYVYIGNVYSEFENTYCPACNKLLIERRGFFILQNNAIGGKCRYCGFEISGIGL